VNTDFPSDTEPTNGQWLSVSMAIDAYKRQGRPMDQSTLRRQIGRGLHMTRKPEFGDLQVWVPDDPSVIDVTNETASRQASARAGAREEAPTQADGGTAQSGMVSVPSDQLIDLAQDAGAVEELRRQVAELLKEQKLLGDTSVAQRLEQQRAIDAAAAQSDREKLEAAHQVSNAKRDLAALQEATERQIRHERELHARDLRAQVTQWQWIAGLVALVSVGAWFALFIR